MSKFVEITDGQDGKIIWIENIDGDVCGICTHDQTIIDVDGLPNGKDIFTSLEDMGFELEQDWDNEQTFIELKDSHGDDCKLVFSGPSVEIVND